jgi:lysozyme family protein
MADFNKAFSASAAARGGYSAISEGVEIYRGIDRRFHPAWEGWPIIDALKFAASDENELQISLAQNKRLREKVRNWFKQVYWDRFSGDRIQDQDIAEELFESSIELAVERAVNCLQKSLNLLNAGSVEKVYVIEDGRLGQETLRALEICLKADGAGYLLNVMRILQALHYIGRIKQNPEKDSFARERLGNLVVTRRKTPSKPAPPKELRVED